MCRRGRVLWIFLISWCVLIRADLLLWSALFNKLICHSPLWIIKFWNTRNEKNYFNHNCFFLILLKCYFYTGHPTNCVTHVGILKNGFNWNIVCIVILIAQNGKSTALSIALFWCLPSGASIRESLLFN